jgi:glycosyltransferase involved in cell wall biosynthesis
MVASGDPVLERGAVSVIIPTRNRPALLRETVASVLRQTRAVEQIVVVDDGSTPPAGLAHTATSTAVELIRHPAARGVSAARNTGLGRARGEFVCFLDDDDLLEPGFVETGLARLDECAGADGVFFRHRVDVLTEQPAHGPGTLAGAAVAKARQLVTHWTSLVRTSNPVPRATLETRPASAFIRYLVPVHAGFLRRSALGPLRFREELRQGEDTHFWLSLAAAGRRFVLDERAYAVVRRHRGNTTCARFRHFAEIAHCYERLLSDGLVSAPEDEFLLRFKLALHGLFTAKRGTHKHLAYALASPRLLASELRFWLRNFSARIVPMVSDRAK